MVNRELYNLQSKLYNPINFYLKIDILTLLITLSYQISFDSSYSSTMNG